MKPRIYLLLAALWLTAWVGPALLPGQKVTFGGEAAHQVSLPFDLFDGVVYLQVTVNDEHEALFVLDSGTDSISVVSNDLAVKMGVWTPEKNRVATRVICSDRFNRLYGTRLKISDALFVGYDFIALPLENLEPYWGRKIDGLIGGNILKDLVVSIDYEKERLTLSDKGWSQDDSTQQRLAMTLMGTTPMVEAVVQGGGDEFKGHFVVDTGVRTSYLTSPFTQKMGLSKTDTQLIENITGFGIGGLIFEAVGRLDRIRLGELVLKNPVLQLSRGQVGMAGSKLFDGIIGADLLNRFNVVLDFPGKAIYLKPNKHFGKVFLYDMSGIYFTRYADEGRPVTIVNIVKESPADRAGLRKNDRLMEVDGQAITHYSMAQLKEHFKREGRRVEIKFERDGKVERVAFTLTPYI